MNKRRLFIAIDLPDKIKNKLISFQEKWFDLPVRWTRKGNLHVTLLFIGYLSDDQMLEVCNLTKQIAQEHEPFEICFKNICLGPPDRPPRMIWLTGEKSHQLAKLRGNLEGTLLNSSGSGFNSGITKALNPHVTLARIEQGRWRELPEQPDIQKQVNFTVPVEQIKVMESRLSRSGAEYSVLESVELGI